MLYWKYMWSLEIVPDLRVYKRLSRTTQHTFFKNIYRNRTKTEHARSHDGKGALAHAPMQHHNHKRREGRVRAATKTSARLTGANSDRFAASAEREMARLLWVCACARVGVGCVWSSTFHACVSCVRAATHATRGDIREWNEWRRVVCYLLRSERMYVRAYRMFNLDRCFQMVNVSSGNYM